MAREHTWDDMIFLLAARAYEGYGNNAGWKNYQGKPMPKWHELAPETRRHWCAAMAAIARPLELPDEGSVH